MPLPVIVTAPGTVMLRPPTLRLKLPGTLNAPRMPEMFLARSAGISLIRLTWTLNVPRTLVSEAVIPEPDCEPPKLRLADATPMAIVRLRVPLLKLSPARPSDGPASDSGPSVIPLEAASRR